MRQVEGWTARGKVSSMLLEREAELAVLEEITSRLPDGGGKVVLIRGEAGIGKSSLVDAFVGRHGDDAHIVSGACDDLFIPQALGPFWDMARAEPAIREPVHAADRPRLMDQLMALLERRDRPTIVVIEDTQWADEATLDIARFLGRRMASTNGVLVLTYRDSELDHEHPLRRVIGDIPVGNIVRMQLAGLSLESIASMLGESALDPADVMTQTHGNPLLVGEIAAATGDAVPGSLQDAVAGQLQKMSIGAQEAVRTLAVIPEPVPLADALGLAGVDEARVEEGVRRGLLELSGDAVTFRHELIRRAIESAMSDALRKAKFRTVLRDLPEDTHPCLIIDCAVEVGDIDRLLEVAPRSARYAAATGSHVQAAEDFRVVGPHVGRFDPAEQGRLLDEWAREEYIVDNLDEATRIGDLACDHYRRVGDARAEARALSWAARYHEVAGHRERAEELAAAAIRVLGDQADGAELARALEVSAYLQMMAGNQAVVPAMVDRTLEVGGSAIEQEVLIRSLNHKGTMLSIGDPRAGRVYLEQARAQAEEAEHWVEVVRAVTHIAWAAVEAMDVRTGLDHSRQAAAIAERHELLSFASYARSLEARALEAGGEWDTAKDVAREVQQASPISRMVGLPILGVIDARQGRPTAAMTLLRAWQLASEAAEYQRMAPACIAAAEYAWITGDHLVETTDMRRVLDVGLRQGFSWSTGSIVRWLGVLGVDVPVPDAIAEPYRLVVEGRAGDAAAAWDAMGLPYEQALALSAGSEAQQLEALERLEALGAAAVAAKLRKSMRGRGIVVPRGKGRATRRHAAGLTARQAEVLDLLAEELSNIEIADRLFLSPRTVENHVAAILDKLDTGTRSEAVARARSEGLLGPTPTSA